MYKGLLSFIFFIGLSANAVANCGNCDPLFCENGTYSLEKVFECLDACKHDGSHHGVEVMQKCQARADKELGGGHEEHKAAAAGDAAAVALSACQKDCEPGSCLHYTLEKALDCQQKCEHEKSYHAEGVRQQCQKRIDDLMTAKEQRVVFPGACGKAKKDEAVLNLVPMEGKLVHSGGKWKFKTFVPGRDGPAHDIDFQISPQVGEIGTGKPDGDVVLLGLTPENLVVTAHVDTDKKMVMCLSQAHRPEVYRAAH
ncbi:MAG: hypothetical protein K0R76_632 [Alphaproteobacteria bacterium]|jgi:hypothetical protein|nr:hypothetical protein [Alphaproteobacteria bacterium]